MGFQMQICPVLRIHFSCERAPAKLKFFSGEDYIPQILTDLLEIHCIYINFHLCGLLSFVFCLSFVNNS